MGSRSHPRGSRRGEVTRALCDLLTDVHKKMEEVKEELLVLLDNLPPYEGEKGRLINDAIDRIEFTCEVECPTELENMQVTWVEGPGRTTGSEQRNNCVIALI